MKVGLALEGGSRQTIFSAGVLDAWLDEGIYFPYISGVSAGCHAAMNFVTRQRGRFRYIIQPTKIQQVGIRPTVFSTVFKRNVTRSITMPLMATCRSISTCSLVRESNVNSV